MMEPSLDSSAPMNVGLIPRWHHVDCFISERPNLEVDSGVTADCFTGFSQLEKKDQDLLKKKLGVTKATKATKGKKRKIEDDEQPQKKQKTAEEEAEEKALKVKPSGILICKLSFYSMQSYNSRQNIWDK